VIQQPAFPVEPWAVRETELHLDQLAQTESVFALSNGHIGLRGNLDEGEPSGLPGTYLAGFYEVRPLPYAEAGYGFPEAGQMVLNVTNGKILRLLVEDEPFDVRYGTLRSHERVLDLRAGVLRRTAAWVSPTGTAVRVSSTRLVSFAQRAVAAILYEVEPFEQTIPVVVQSELFANEPLPDTEADSRAAAMLSAPLRSLYSAARETRAVLAHATTASGLTMAAAMDHVIDGPEGTAASEESFEDLARVMVSAEIAPDRPLRVVKFLAYGWSSQRSMPSVRDQVAAALAEARHTGWDTETFVLPVLTYTAPHAARDALCWRHATLDLARERAQQIGVQGAAFPWRTIRGQECSGYWPAGTAAFHINADVADAVVRYQAATGDEAFERDTGLELLVETARLWRVLGHHDAVGRFRIDGVTGPDEYSAIADNNVYTNLMAQRNLRAAAEAAERQPDLAAKFGVDDEETAGWRDAAKAMLIPYDAALGVHPQAESFTQHKVWDFEHTSPEQYPLLLHFPYFELYRKQVVKQADLVMALYLRGDAFTAEQKARNFDYYEGLTVRDSSLSACIQSVIAAEVGHLELAYDYLAEAALMDLDDLEHNTRDGLHIASLAGTWIGAVAGLGGMRDHGGILSFAPRLPQTLTRLAFRVCYRDRRLLVTVEPDQATYTLTGGTPLEFVHHGESATVHHGRSLKRAIPAPRAREAPSQPSGRAPARRGVQR
jgi:alpha,alpha-trehalose phosphorylase